LLYVYELDRGGRASQGIKALKVDEVLSAEITDQPFTPRYRVEL
jgi:hypothetical protein